MTDVRLYKQCLCNRLADDHFPFSASDLLAQLCFLWNKKQALVIYSWQRWHLRVLLLPHPEKCVEEGDNLHQRKKNKMAGTAGASLTNKKHR